MPIIVPTGLPAIEALAKENITLITECRAKNQDIRPLEIVILNLMPTKIATENQLIRLLSNTALQVEVTFLQTATYVSKNTATKHLEIFYQQFDAIKDKCFDGLIITGAPVETLAFEEVDYWDELCAIMEWSKTNVFSTMHICWGAQAGLYYHYGIPKYPLDNKLFGVFTHVLNEKNHPLIRGFDEEYLVPHSRHTEVRIQDVKKIDELEILSTSAKAGLCLVASIDFRQIYMTGHAEYDADTLALEYFRDRGRGLEIDVPINYFPDDNPGQSPKNCWRGHAYLMLTNWVNHVYQEVPYEISKIKELDKI